MSLATMIVTALGVYLLCGLLFALPFVLAGVNRMDPHARAGTWGFRVLVLPGAVFLWPLLLRRWLGGVQHPPAERTAHRCAAIIGTRIAFKEGFKPMTRPLRQLHRRAFILLALLVPLVFIAGLLARRAVPLMPADAGSSAVNPLIPR